MELKCLNKYCMLCTVIYLLFYMVECIFFKVLLHTCSVFSNMYDSVKYLCPPHVKDFEIRYW